MIVRAKSQSTPMLLQLPQGLRLHVTPEQFAAIAAINRDLRLERTATGLLIVNPPTGSEAGHRNFSLIAQLAHWCDRHEAAGIAFDSSTGFTLPNGAIRSPDLSWVRRDRWEALTPAQRKGFAPLCPDFVVELRSETDTLNDLQAKMQEYLENGAQLGWLIDPKHQRVEIYRPNQTVEVLEHPSCLLGEDILPEFMLTLKRIWASD
jgi:Uma2 family endonuclease